MTVQRQVANISEDTETQLLKIIKCIYYSPTVDKSRDITSTTRMFILHMA